MKIITFWGGLGNQIFEYAYYKWLQEKYPNDKIYGYYPKVGLAVHNGLEINKRFEVELPPSTKFTNIIGLLLFNLNRVCRRLKLPLLSTCTHANEKYDSLFHCDYFQDKKYLVKSLCLDFRLNGISNQNKSLIKEIETKDFVSVHIRRGDYLSHINSRVFGGICTEEYYIKAIERIRISAPNVKLIFFSDDTKYVKDTFKYDNMQVVDWNNGENSIYDMYLMSKCKYMILANSTFSYWAACMNKNAKVVICPSKWNNIRDLNLSHDSWIKI